MFPDPNDDEENREREDILGSIDRFWSTFTDRAEDISAAFCGKKQWDLPAWMSENLARIDPRLMWEFGPGIADGHRLVITPEIHRELRPLVSRILERAPQLQDWTFFPYRLADSIDACRIMVEGRTGRPQHLERARVDIGELNRVDLTFALPSSLGVDADLGRDQAFVSTETLLGEEVLDKWIGDIDVQPIDDESLVPLVDLKDVVDQVIARARERCLEAPCHQLAEHAKWTLFKLNPDAAEDYTEQQDMFVGKTMLVDMWKCAHMGAPFHSGRFSRYGETFCYLKIDGAGGLDEERFKDKSEIEDAIDAVLIPNRAGCVIGGGTGLRYSYIDFALTDVDRALPLVIKRLREGNVPRRSWILFFDDELGDEWIGVWDDSPAPPRERAGNA
jgi:hypothetical protein